MPFYSTQKFIDISCFDPREQYHQRFTRAFLYEHHLDSFFYIRVTRKKLPKQHLYEKFVHIMLMKLSPRVNFINVKHANFTYERLFSSYVLALNKLSYEKRAQKMLMILSPREQYNVFDGISYRLYSFSRGLDDF